MIFLQTTSSRAEWRRVAVFALFIMALTTIPYAMAWANQTDEWRFSGSLNAVEDGNSYLAKTRLGAAGHWDFFLFYTPEPTDSAPLIFLPYLLPGQIVGQLVEADDLPAALILTFHAMRIGFGVILILVMYRFIAAFLHQETLRLHALILATLGGGLGWLLVFIGGSTPVEFTIPEAFSFLVLYTLPHRSIGRAAMLMGFVLLIDRGERPFRRAIVAGVCWNVVALCVPFYLSVIYVLLGVWGLAAWGIQRRFPRDLFFRAVLAAALTLPLFGYLSLAFTWNPAFVQWSAQNLLPSPPPLDYLWAYLPLLALGAFALRSIWKRARRHIRYALVIGWLIAAPILVYLPINVQRRLAEGIILPVAILAAWGLHRLLASRREMVRRWIGRAVIGGVSLSAIMLLSTGFLWATQRTSPLFIPAAQIDAFAWLRDHAPPGSVVLGTWETGNRLPVYTDLRPFVGLGPETLDAKPREAQMIAYYRGELDGSERETLYQSPCESVYAVENGQPCQIAYVIYSDSERRYDRGASSTWAADLTLVYDANGVQIFAVAP